MPCQLYRPSRPAQKLPSQGAVKVSDRITCKLPLLPAGETIMFVTTDNNLVANDPRQASLELKGVEVKVSEPLKQIANS